MMMRMLLLVSAVVLLVSPAVINPHRFERDTHLNTVFDEATKYETQSEVEDFLEDVSHLAEGQNKCADKFFCKVQDILHAYPKTTNSSLVRNLKQYLHHRKSNCTALKVTPTNVGKKLSALMGYLKTCIQHRNLNGTNQS